MVDTAPLNRQATQTSALPTNRQIRGGPERKAIRGDSIADNARKLCEQMKRLTAGDGGNHTAKVHNETRGVKGDPINQQIYRGPRHRASRTPKKSHSADSRDNKRKVKNK